MKEPVNFLPYAPDLYIPPVIKSYGKSHTHSGKIHQTALEFINEFLFPLFNQFQRCLPNEPMVELRVSFINSLWFQIQTYPESPGLYVRSMFKELSLFHSALEHILEIGHFYGFDAERKMGYWSFTKYFGEAAEQKRILDELNSYKEQQLSSIIVAAKASKDQDIKRNEFSTKQNQDKPIFRYSKTSG